MVYIGALWRHIFDTAAPCEAFWGGIRFNEWERVQNRSAERQLLLFSMLHINCFPYYVAGLRLGTN